MIKKFTIIISMLVILSMVVTSVGLAQEDVQTAADSYFSGGTQNIKAADLYDILNDGDTSNDPFIIDARSPEDYALGHIPGAVNIGAKAAFTADKLAMIPEDQDVVVYCYTGQTSSQMAPALNMLGYSAKSMLFGFPAWAMVEGVSVAPFDLTVDGNDYMVSTEAAAAEGSYDVPAALDSTVAGAAAAYFSNGTKNIPANALFENLNDGDASNDPYIIDVRAAEDYALGHIPGAVNMSAKELFTAANLATIPADQPVVVGCYTGQTASQVTSALNMLGYDASNLKFGFASWSPTGKYPFDPAASSNYAYEGTGATAETPAATEAAPAAAQAPATLPESGGAAFTWIYLLLGSGLLGGGAYFLRRK
jgi:LPXTG-motif cell wall-anchored protein